MTVQTITATEAARAFSDLLNRVRHEHQSFVILRGGVEEGADGSEYITALRNHVAHEIGPIAKPRQIMIVSELPKTRSGKIMRRLLRDVAENRSLGDVTTLADPHVMHLIETGLQTGTSED